MKVVRVFSYCDDNYISYLSALICSINENVSAKYTYNIYIVAFDISNENKEKILDMQLNDNVHLIFKMIKDDYILSKASEWNYGRWSKELYITVLAPYIFAEFDKIIYLDCDVINLRDLADLYCKNITGYYVAASRNLGRCSLKNNNFFTPQVLKYEHDTNIDQFSNYFNNGIMLMNLHEIRMNYLLEQLLDVCCDNQYELLDQDCLNYLCKDRVLFVEAGWNWYPYSAEEFNNVIKLCPDSLKEYFIDGYKNNYNIHYTIPIKPWLQMHGVYNKAATIFWQYMIKSSFCSAALAEMRDYNETQNIICNLKKKELSDFVKLLNIKKVCLYGLGKNGENYINNNLNYIDIIIDNDSKKQGQYKSIEVVNFDMFLEKNIKSEECVVLISNDDYSSIVKKFLKYGYENIFLLQELYRNSFSIKNVDMKDIVEVFNVLKDQKSIDIYTNIIDKRIRFENDKNIKCLDIYEGDMYLKNSIVCEKFTDADVRIMKNILYESRRHFKNCFFYRGHDILEQIQEDMHMIKNDSYIFIDVDGKCDYLWKIPLELHVFFPEHDFYYRHHGVSLYGTVLYVVPR